MRKPIGVATGLMLLLAVGSAMADEFLGPLPYLSADDRPFSDEGFEFSELEDFEDGELNLIGVLGSAGAPQGPDDLRDSVDADDGDIDGSGRNGWSWYVSSDDCVRFSFGNEFAPDLPTHVGIVWTDVGDLLDGSNGFADVTFEAFGAENESLGTITAEQLGDGAQDGATAEDRFFGVIHVGGISSIELCSEGSNDWELDHLYIGRVPEPTSALLVVAAGLMLAGRRRSEQ